MKKGSTITVVGIGGVGGYFGGMIARKNRMSDLGHTVNFVARGDHLTAIKKKGLILNNSEETGLKCEPDLATDDFSSLPESDIVILAVKSYDLDDVIDRLPGILKPDSTIIPLLNGVDIYERIRKKLPGVTILPACVYVAAYIEKPGSVTCQEKSGLLILGKDPLHHEIYPEHILKIFDDAGIYYKWFDDPYPAIWEKYTFVASLALVTAYYHQPIGGIMSDPETKKVTEKIMREIVAIARKNKVLLPDNLVDKLLERAAGVAYEIRTSYQRDLESKKHKNEGDIFGGTIEKLGKQLGIETPATSKLYKELQHIS